MKDIAKRVFTAALRVLPAATGIVEIVIIRPHPIRAEGKSTRKDVSFPRSRLPEETMVVEAGLAIMKRTSYVGASSRRLAYLDAGGKLRRGRTHSNRRQALTRDGWLTGKIKNSPGGSHFSPISGSATASGARPSRLPGFLAVDSWLPSGHLRRRKGRPLSMRTVKQPHRDFPFPVFRFVPRPLRRTQGRRLRS